MTQPEKQRAMAQEKMEIQSNPSKAQIAIGALLEKRREKCTFIKGFLTPNGYHLVDFYLPKPKRLCIEIMKELPGGKRVINSFGYKTLIITESEAVKMNLEEFNKLLK